MNPAHNTARGGALVRGIELGPHVGAEKVLGAQKCPSEDPALSPVVPPLPTSARSKEALGIYVHIPFCLVRCPYCDFNAYADLDDLIDPYLDALVREIEAAGDGSHVSTVFFGGGTPTQVPPGKLGSVLRAIEGSFALAGDAEVTVEANPETVDERVFAELLGAGFNRVSVGVQSLSPRVLQRLGRAHDAERALGALLAARRAGFHRVNADLIFGTPGESMQDWRASLDSVLEAGVDHVSCYALTVEEGTPLASWVEQRKVAPPDEDDQAAKYEIAHEALTGFGFVRYEISNWCRPGSWSRHNLNYWQQGDYLAFGAGAHGHREGRRWWNVKLPRDYIRKSPDAEDGFELIAGRLSMEEHATLGLRLAGGIGRADFGQRFGIDPLRAWPGVFENLEGLGLVMVDPSAVRLSDGGMLLAGHVFRELTS